MSNRLSVWKIERKSGNFPDYDRDCFADIHYFSAGVTPEHVKAVLIEEGYITDQDEVYLDYEEDAELIPNF